MLRWTEEEYPNSLKNHHPEIKKKAIEIANILVEEEEMEDGIAIATAISRARDWAENRGIESSPGPQVIKQHGQDQYVYPHERGWAVKSEKAEKPREVFDSRDEAISAATEYAIQNNTNLIIQRADGRIEEKISYNPRRYE